MHRRYDLDWLRVGVFGLLIIYHVGMYYIPWSWHINSTPTHSGLRWPMLFLNQWRLPILFVISGMGTGLALKKRTSLEFIRERFKRLFIPLLFGMCVIVPPQVWVERVINEGYTLSLWHYYINDAFEGIYPSGNFSWHHLWFLPYLLIYSIILSPIFIYLNHNSNGAILRWTKHILTRRAAGIYIFIIPLFLIEAFVEPFFPVTHALIDDWFTFLFYIVLFFYGFLLINLRDRWWLTLDKLRPVLLPIGILTFCCYYGIKQFEDSTVVHFVEAAIKVTNLWTWILILFAYSARHLNHENRSIKYANRAVYPFYILHQTITILLIYWIRNIELPLYLEAFYLIAGTFLICWILYHFVIRPIKVLHPFFGMK